MAKAYQGRQSESARDREREKKIKEIRGIGWHRSSSDPPGKAGEAEAQNETRTEGGVFTSCASIPNSDKSPLRIPRFASQNNTSCWSRDKCSLSVAHISIFATPIWKLIP